MTINGLGGLPISRNHHDFFSDLAETMAQEGITTDISGVGGLPRSDDFEMAKHSSSLNVKLSCGVFIKCMSQHTWHPLVLPGLHIPIGWAVMDITNRAMKKIINHH